MWKDRVPCKADSTHLLPLLYMVARPHNHASRLHVHEQAVLVVLVVDKYEVADVFRVSTSGELGMSNCCCLRVFKPVVGDVIGRGENDPRSGCVDGLAVAVPVLQLSGIVMIRSPFPVNVYEIAGVCRDAPALDVGVAKGDT